MHYIILLPVIIYFITLIGFNFYIKLKDRKNPSSTSVIKSYAMQKLPPLALAMTSAATYASASSFIGGPGSAYYYGIGWILIAMIQVPTMWFAFSLIGPKINEYATKHNCHTVNDILKQRYHSLTLVNLTSVILILCFIASIVVQFIGAARLLQGALNISYQSSLLSFVIVIAIYTLFGNFKTVAYSDILQGTIMFVGSIVLLTLVIVHVGGFGNAIDIIAHRNPELLNPYNKVITPELYFSFWVLVCFGVVGLPQTILRTMVNQTKRQRNKSILIATIVLFVVLFSMHLSGFLGNALIPRDSFKSPDLVIPTLITKVMTPFVASVFLIAPMASIISTIDSQLIQTTSTIVNDLYINNVNNLTKTKKTQHKTLLNQEVSQDYIDQTNADITSFVQSTEQKEQEPKYTRLIIRLTTLTLIGLSLIFSINPPNILIWLNILSFGGLQATFLWPVVLGMFVPSLNKYSALASVLTGIGTYAFFTTLHIKFLGMHQIVPALAFSFIMLVLVQLITMHKFKPKN